MTGAKMELDGERRASTNSIQVLDSDKIPYVEIDSSSKDTTS